MVTQLTAPELADRLENTTLIEINSGKRAVELEAEAAALDTGANNCSA